MIVLILNICVFIFVCFFIELLRIWVNLILKLKNEIFGVFIIISLVVEIGIFVKFEEGSVDLIVIYNFG